MDGIKRVQVLDKEGIIDNEINNFRYDVMIEVDKSKIKSTDSRTQIKSNGNKLNKFQVNLDDLDEILFEL